MAKERKKTSDQLIKAGEGSIADLIGPCITIHQGDGLAPVVIPADKKGNTIANMIVAAEVRNMIQRTIKKYREQDLMPNPKDLKDLAEAARSLATFSGDVYKDDDASLNAQPKKVEKAPAEEADVSFDSIEIPEKK